MASFLKIGKRILNLDTITSIHTDVQLYGTTMIADGREMTGYVVPGVEVWFGINDSEKFKGEEANILRAWLELTAIDAATAYVAK